MTDGPPPALWDEDRSRHWVQESATRERQLEPVLDMIFTAAELHPGETVLDVGCGTGPTTARAATAVGGSGSVIGADVSAVMIAAARRRVLDPQVRWLCADVTDHPFPPAEVDAVVSRFGVMFFADPERAFANLARATRVGGRLTMAVWRPRGDCPFFDVPLRCVLGTLDRLGFSSDATMSGPFSFGVPSEVEPLLTRAGWSDVRFAPHDEPPHLGGPNPVERIAELATDHGPVRVALEGQPGPVLARVRADLVELIAAEHDGTGWPLAAGVSIITGRRDRSG